MSGVRDQHRLVGTDHRLPADCHQWPQLRAASIQHLAPVLGELDT